MVRNQDNTIADSKNDPSLKAVSYTHLVGEDSGFMGIKPLEVDCHHQGRKLIIRNGTIGTALDHKADLFIGQGESVTFLMDDVIHSHSQTLLYDFERPEQPPGT